MIGSLTKSIGLIVRHPASLWPAFLVGLVSAFMTILLSDALAEATYSLFVDGNIPFIEGDAVTMLFAIYSAYGATINLVLLSWVIVGILSVLVMFYYAHFAKDQKAGFGKAWGQLGGAISYLVFYALVSVLLFAIFLLVTNLTPLLGVISLLLLVVLAIAGAIVFLRLSFTVPVMALKKVNVKKGLEGSWQFTKGRVFEVFIFFILVSIIAIFIGGVQNFVLDVFEVLYWDQTLVEVFGFEVVPLLVTTLFSGLATAFTGLVFPVYYLSKGRS